MSCDGLYLSSEYEEGLLEEGLFNSIYSRKDEGPRNFLSSELKFFTRALPKKLKTFIQHVQYFEALL